MVQSWQDFGTNWAVVGLVIAALALISVPFNRLTAWLDHEYPGHPFTAGLVIVGTLYTLAGLAILNPLAAVLALACFAGSGAPMAIGAADRFLETLKRWRTGVATAAHRQAEALDADRTARMAEPSTTCAQPGSVSGAEDSEDA